jgi:hypothetical protein
LLMLMTWIDFVDNSCDLLPHRMWCWHYAGRVAPKTSAEEARHHRHLSPTLRVSDSSTVRSTIGMRRVSETIRSGRALCNWHFSLPRRTRKKKKQLQAPLRVSSTSEQTDRWVLLDEQERSLSNSSSLLLLLRACRWGRWFQEAYGDWREKCMRVLCDGVGSEWKGKSSAAPLPPAVSKLLLVVTGGGYYSSIRLCPSLQLQLGLWSYCLFLLLLLGGCSTSSSFKVRKNGGIFGDCCCCCFRTLFQGGRGEAVVGLRRCWQQQLWQKWRARAC